MFIQAQYHHDIAIVFPRLFLYMLKILPPIVVICSPLEQLSSGFFFSYSNASSVCLTIVRRGQVVSIINLF